MTDHPTAPFSSVSEPARRKYVIPVFWEAVFTPEEAQQHANRIRQANRPHADVPMDMD